LGITYSKFIFPEFAVGRFCIKAVFGMGTVGLKWGRSHYRSAVESSVTDEKPRVGKLIPVSPCYSAKLINSLDS
jgi:hypothetical protein